MSNPTTVPASLRVEQNGYLETIGRTSSLPRETEIWFVADGNGIYLLSGYHNRKDWVRNLTKTPGVRFRIADRWFTGIAHEVTGDAGAIQHARQLLATKYYNGDLNAGGEWAKTGTPYVIELGAAAQHQVLDDEPRTGFIETIGRRSGEPRMTQVGYAVEGDSLVMISSAGISSDWIRNLVQTPSVRFRIGDTWHRGTARVAASEAEIATTRARMLAKYANRGRPTEWIESGLPVIVAVNPASEYL